MKLLIKSYIYYFIISLAIFLLGSFAIYYSILSTINEQVVEHLRAEKPLVIHQLRVGRDYREINSNIGVHIYIKPIKKIDKTTDEIRDFSYPDRGEMKEIIGEMIDEYLTFRELTFQTEAGGQFYEVSISKSLAENKQIKQSVISVVAALAAAMLASLLLINYRISKQIWSPFYDTINILRRLDPSQNIKAKFKRTNVREFQILNEVIYGLQERISIDYSNLKEFTENTSHELQTPLAIINSKLELLLQTDGLSVEQSELVKSAYSSVKRLSKLNQSLLMLSRIENRQFSDTREVDVVAQVNNKIKEFEDFIEMKSLVVSVNVEHELKLMANPTLIDVTINNLLNNAIRHNCLEGKIIVDIYDRGIKVSNTSYSPPIDPARLFLRFRKGKSADSTGLGLAIVKEICDYFNYSVKYAFEDNLHSFTIDFDKPLKYTVQGW